MSRTTIYGVTKDGALEELAELRNSWLLAPLVWDRMHEKYLGKWDFRKAHDDYDAAKARGEDPGEFDRSGWSAAWKLAKDPRISESDYAVLLVTFDHYVCPREHMIHAAEQFEVFAKGTENPGHFDALPGIFRKAHSDGYEGVCLQQTSTSDSMWWVHGGEDEDGRPYDFNVDTKHWYFNPDEHPARAAEPKVTP